MRPRKLAGRMPGSYCAKAFRAWKKKLSSICFSVIGARTRSATAAPRASDVLKSERVGPRRMAPAAPAVSKMRSRVAAFTSSRRSNVAAVISPRLTSSLLTIWVLPTVNGCPFSEAGIVTRWPVQMI